MKRRTTFSLTVFVLDNLLLVGLFYLMTVLRHWSLVLPDQFWLSVLILCLVSFIALYLISGYDGNVDMLSLSYTSQHMIAIFGALVSTILIIYSFTFSPSWQFSRSVLPLTFLCFVPLSLSYRRAMSLSVIGRLKEHYFWVIGHSTRAKQFYRDYLKADIPQRLRFARFSVDDEKTTIDGEGSPIVEALPAETIDYDDEKCDGIILADGRVGKSHMDSLVNVHFSVAPVMPLETFYEEYFQKIYMPKVDHMWLLDDGFILVSNSVYDKFKRIVDVLFSLIVMILASPLCIVIILMIWITEGKAAIFRQERVGKNSKSFTIYKFRSMRDNSENGDRYTRENDDRITLLGGWLRKLRFDELPQLWNVFKGDMSMIGPRAEWIKLTDDYEKKIPYYHFRHLVRPGITGWAQVNYPYGESLEDTRKKLEYDLYYIRRHSLLLDAKIILKTIYIMLFGKGR